MEEWIAGPTLRMQCWQRETSRVGQSESARKLASAIATLHHNPTLQTAANVRRGLERRAGGYK